MRHWEAADFRLFERVVLIEPLLAESCLKCKNGVMGADDSSQNENVQEPARTGLGDLAGAFFESLGVTEDRYRAVKVALHLDPKCNCADRRRWLNEVGAELGVDGVVMKMARWMDRRKGGGGKGEGGT